MSRYADAEAFRAALEARLHASATAAVDVNRRRRIQAFDRLLARLAYAEHGRWVLKGGAALEFRMPDRARTTRDIDLALASDEDLTERLSRDIDSDPFGDYFSFRITGRRNLNPEADRGAVVRLSVDCSIGTRLFDQFVVDLVGPGGAPRQTDRVELGRFLDFAEIPTVHLAVIDLRTHWAEKLSAYLQRYGERPNTRVRDLIDLVLLIETGLTPDDQLRDAVLSTFSQRNQTPPGQRLASMASEWAEPYAAIAADLQIATVSAVDAHALVETFWRQALRTTGAPPA